MNSVAIESLMMSQNLLLEIRTEWLRDCEIPPCTEQFQSSIGLIDRWHACLHRAFCWKVEILVEKLASRRFD